MELNTVKNFSHKSSPEARERERKREKNKKNLHENPLNLFYII